MRKWQKEMLKYLGKDYRMQLVDIENCIYRDLGDYDIVVCLTGCRKRYVDIEVWRTKEKVEIVERSLKVNKDFVTIKILLDGIVQRYSKRVEK